MPVRCRTEDRTEAYLGAWLAPGLVLAGGVTTGMHQDGTVLAEPMMLLVHSPLVDQDNGVAAAARADGAS